jgi:fluoride exporter
VTVWTWVGVALVGGVGAIARVLVAGAIAARAPEPFPWPTLVVNLSGALLLGLVSGLALHGSALLIAGTGLLGAYTTFSTLIVETTNLPHRLAALYVVVSVVLGVLAVLLGRWLGGL